MKKRDELWEQVSSSWTLMTWTWLVIIGGHATLVFSLRPNYAKRKTRTGGPWPREVIFPFFLSCSSTKEAFSSIIFIFPAQCFLSDFSILSYHYFLFLFSLSLSFLPKASYYAMPRDSHILPDFLILSYHYFFYLSCPMLPIRQCLGTHTSCQISLVRRRWPPLTTALIIGISIRRTSHKSNLT